MADISPDNLFKALTGSFSPDANQRREAENIITAAQRQQGFMQALCRVWIEDKVESVIRQSAAIQVKNGIKNFWSRRVQYDGSVQQITEPGPSGYELCDADKAFVLSNIVDIAVHAKGDAKLRNLAIECVRECIHREYPACWPDLLPQALSLIAAIEDPNKVMVGLLVIRKIAREFEMKARGRPGRESLDSIVQALPQLLALGEKLYPSAEAMDTQAVDMLRVIAKTFHSCIQTSLHESLITDHASCGRWMELFLKCSTMLSVPTSKLPADHDQRQQIPLAKLQKWTMRNIHRFIGRFGNPRLVAAHEADQNVAVVMTNFAQWWLDTFGPGMTQQMIELLQKRVTQGAFVSDQVLYQVFGFIAEAAQHSITYKVIKPHLQFLVHDVVLPVLSFSHEDQQLWEADPDEFIRRQGACETIFSDPRSAAGDLLRSFVSYRGRDSLSIIMASISTDLEAYSRMGDKVDMAACCRKDGALNALENIAEQLALAAVEKSGKSKKSKKGKKNKKPSAVENQLPDVNALQQMLVNVVLPEYKSRCAFLRLRACSTFEAFVTENIEFSAEVFGAAFVATKACLSDTELPVRVQAGGSIKPFFNNCSPTMRPMVAQSVPEVIDRLLRLTQEVDSESLAATLESMATEFSDAVGPYASQAVNHLVPTFLRQMKAEETDDDTSMAAMGTIQTILSLMDSVFKNPAALGQCEQSVCGLLDALFTPDGIDYFEDGLEILTGVTFTAPQPLPESLWRYYCLIHQAVCGGNLPGHELTGPLSEGWAADYLENMLGPLDNYLSRGTQTWLTGVGPTGMRYTEMLFAIVKKGMEMQDDYAAAQSAKMAALVFENCKAGQADDWLEPYVGLLATAMKSCDKSKGKQDELRWIIYAFVMMLWYSPNALVAVLDKHNLTLDVLSAIIQGAGLLRSHDEKKALILALGNLLRSMPQLPAHVQGTCKKVVQTAYEQCKEVHTMRLKAKEKAAHRGDDDEDDDDDSDWVEEDDEGLIQDLGDDEDASASRQVKLMQEVRAQLMAVLAGEADDDDEDDSDYDDDEDDDENKTSALDRYDEFIYLGETLSQCPALLEHSDLSPQDQQTWKNIIQERANQLAQKQQQQK
ncbi:hypothetical protein Pmar_PMAR005270 [Perkinsus marinus ATCC 50983]|uniref:Importin N-terminal domain-containing protein n=1 Tax=Perkinsus marinus (strain ATCC 50983 / TXsc) TaxID=423536 RepID=C5KB34_PERM5|nr:hypothetical protein Pmar_PMAR005270 [Perkinsus marinus ATCC 50983]EER18360.1 hypothetical protein Pmar_PMAR005270 [Perkinsus marinus ATCC 50983]|eukprot:XP_002786564.1 hypothetical protein Pmar_PMAR005270 [Perkinsus marinus ATCC 50983]